MTDYLHKLVITVDEAAEWLRTTTEVVDRLAAEGRIPAIRYGDGDAPVFRPEDVVAFIEEQAGASGSQRPTGRYARRVGFRSTFEGVPFPRAAEAPAAPVPPVPPVPPIAPAPGGKRIRKVVRVVREDDGGASIVMDGGRRRAKRIVIRQGDPGDEAFELADAADQLRTVTEGFELPDDDCEVFEFDLEGDGGTELAQLEAELQLLRAEVARLNAERKLL